MRIPRKAWGGVPLGVAAAVMILHAPATAQDPDRRPAQAPHGASKARILLPDKKTEWRLRQAIDGAHEWLGSPSCRAIFSDFEDVSGTRLSDVLAERSLTGQEQLDRLGFYDGSHLRQCRAPGAVFVTSPGYAVVFVCMKGLRQLSTPHEARATVLHEVLHTLGLGENPPAPHEITRRVLERCGRKSADSE